MRIMLLTERNCVRHPVKGSSKGERKTSHAPEEVEGDGPDARVEDILDEDVHHVLGADRAGAELQGQRQSSARLERQLHSD